MVKCALVNGRENWAGDETKIRATVGPSSTQYCGHPSWWSGLAPTWMSESEWILWNPSLGCSSL